MNAQDIIHLIESLPPAERAEVIDFARHLPTPETQEALEEAKKSEQLESFNNVDDLFRSAGV